MFNKAIPVKIGFGGSILQIPLARPDISKMERDMVLKVLRTPRLSLGPMLRAFEDRLAHYIGVRHAVAVNSGTAALHLAVRALGLGEGDEVITTPFSFVASANCLLYERARPVFVDIEPQALNLDPEKVKAAITEHTKAILAVDVFGHPADWDQIAAIAQKHGLKLIEDSAEAFGSSYRGRRAGGLGDVGVFGFYPNKQITTGEGGAILTDIEEIAQLCRSMRNQGRSERVDWLEHEHLGYNYRLDELSAALGVAQLARIDEILARRARVAQLYEQKLKDMDEVKTPSLTPGVTPSWFAYVIRFVQGIDRDRLMEYMKTHGVQTRAYFSPIHLQPFYQKLFGYREGDFPLTEEISRRVLSLPFYGQMREEEIDYVVRTLKKGLRILRS